MIYKLKTSSETQEIFSNLYTSTGLQPYVLSKIAIALSIRQGVLNEDDYNTNTNGLELNRQTIFGDTEALFKSLMARRENKSITDDLFFPKMVKAHLDRGARLLNNEARYSKNLYVGLCQLEDNL